MEIGETPSPHYNTNKDKRNPTFILFRILFCCCFFLMPPHKLQYYNNLLKIFFSVHTQIPFFLFKEGPALKGERKKKQKSIDIIRIAMFISIEVLPGFTNNANLYCGKLNISSQSSSQHKY